MDAPRLPIAAALAAALAAVPVHAVQLGEQGRGQALIYPYFTVQSAHGDAFNTYVSVVNHSSDAKAVRVRFREARDSRPIASFNLYLGPGDAWTAAVVPASEGSGGAGFLTRDRSCTSPSLQGSPATLAFASTFYSGPYDDGNGAGLDRTREGFLEMIEMATLDGSSARAVTRDPATGMPSDCAAVLGNTALEVAAPSGGLSGTLTLINVANGMDFGTDAIALDDLAARPFYRPPDDPYPDFNAFEIAPVSAIVSQGTAYRSSWIRAADAVSAVLMRADLEGEYVLDAGTLSRTDFVVAFPTRQFYVTPASAAPPFGSPARWDPACRIDGVASGEHVALDWSDREGARATPDATQSAAAVFCAAVAVFDVSDGSPHTAHESASGVLGSTSGGFGVQTVDLGAGFASGWLRLAFDAPAARAGITTLRESERLDGATGELTGGAHSLSGLPAIGFAVRTFTNGTLSCAAGACQGNYGSLFALKSSRAIAP